MTDRLEGLLDSHRAEREPTMHDVAERAGVAVSSVSRVLSGHPDVSGSMKKRVLDAAEALGYEPDLLAQSFRRGLTNTVGFVVRDIANPLFASIATGAERVLRSAGLMMLLSNSDGDPTIESEHIQLLRRRRVDGFILSLVTEDAGTDTTLSSLRAPSVLLDRTVADFDAASVLSDHYSGLLAATSDLVNTGHTRIALITGDESVRPTRERIRGIADALISKGLRFDRDLLSAESFAADYAARETIRLLSLAEPPTAIIAGGIQSSIGALGALANRSMVLGRDISFIACDETPLLQMVRPSISVVARDPERIGAEAANLLLEMRSGAAARSINIPTQYIARDSTSMMPRT